MFEVVLQMQVNFTTLRAPRKLLHDRSAQKLTAPAGSVAVSPAVFITSPAVPAGAITSPAAPPGSIPGMFWAPGGGPANWSPTTGTVPSVTSGIAPRPFAVSGVMVNTETITVIAPPQRASTANQRTTWTPYQR